MPLNLTQSSSGWIVGALVLITMVFDTTASNSGAHSGICRFVEEFLEAPLLWLACRHNELELHIKHLCIHVTGNTKDPGLYCFSIFLPILGSYTVADS